MLQDIVPGLIALAVIGLLVGLLAWALAMQKKALVKQQQAMGSIDESLALARRGVELQERGIQLAELSAKNQEEIIRLLREVVSSRRAS